MADTPDWTEMVNSDRYWDRLHVLLDQEHAAFKALFFPFLSIKVIEADVAELIHDA